ncbi:hypothetical protein AVEN_63850-1 [Araneus ventricosus]|uniref:Uncharacterized protein n=1 Tax=Araneus ventricosus TaxID=182803 RepID=A0A4Y2JQC0_ARAVE|nr:hypothetical protein AVEN_63850-1 [Araneus ventricosus]
MWIRTQELSPVYPKSNSLGNKECIEYYHLQFIFKGRTSNLGYHPHRKENDRMILGAIETGLGLNNVNTFYLLLCPGIGNTWTSR